MPRAVAPLPPTFYARPTLDVARDLIGATVVHVAEGVRRSGRIVEVEAYIGESDPGCHASAGPTSRNAPLYGPPGRAYVYLNYGVHCLLNAVTEAAGHPAAVLIRALEPLEGIEAMRAARGSSAGFVGDADLCRGPGRLSRALGVTLAHNRVPLTGGTLVIGAGVPAARVVWTRRIGLSRGADRYWRCVAPESPSLSGSRAWNQDARARPTPQPG